MYATQVLNISISDKNNKNFSKLALDICLCRNNRIEHSTHDLIIDKRPI